jgi:predicted transcriptional regulator
MPLEKNDALLIIQTILSFLKEEPPTIQAIWDAYSMAEQALKSHIKDANDVIDSVKRR